MNEFGSSLILLTGKGTIIGLPGSEIGLQDIQVDECAETNVEDSDSVHGVQEPAEVIEETLIFDIESTPSTSRIQNAKNYRKKASDPLLDVYREGQQSERLGLSEIAIALNRIAEGIERFCDIYENKLYFFFLCYILFILYSK